MAIKITIPNYGDVEVEGIAQEDTMRQILAALTKTSGGQTSAGKEKLKADKELLNTTEETTSELEKLVKETKRQQQASSTASKMLNTFATDTATATGAVVASLSSFGGTLAKTVAAVTYGLAKNFESAAENPIATGAALLNTALDLGNQAVKLTIDGVSALGQALTGWIPEIGGGIAGGIKAIGEVSKEAADLATNVLKDANEVMAKQYENTVRMLGEFAKTGASFAGGMTEMRTVAVASGIGIDNFAKAVSNSRQSIADMGFTATDAVQFLSKGLMALSTTTGKSGQVLRNELLNIGYSYQEQGEVMAQYSAIVAASGKLRSMTDKDIAQGTAQYAKDLKVLADITGEDAKKRMDDARQAAMRSDVLAQLKPDQVQKFIQGFAAVPKWAQKGALEYFASGGTAVVDQTANLFRSMGPGFDQIVSTLFKSVKDSSVTASQVQEQTMAASIEAAKGYAKNPALATASLSATLGNSSLQSLADAAREQNELALKSVDQLKKSIETTENMSTTTDAVSKNFGELTGTMTNFSNKMNEIVTDNLPAYSNIIKDLTTKTVKLVSDVADFTSGKISKEQFMKNIGADVVGSPTGKTSDVGKVVGTTGGALAGGIAGGVAGRYIGGLLGTALGPVGTAAGIAIGTYGGAYIGNKLGGLYDNYNSASDATKAKSSADAGYNLNTPMAQQDGAVQASLNHQTNLLQTIADKLDTANKHQQKIVQLSS